jgi:serine/threonine protein kinase
MIMHRDIKLENIMIDKDNIKVVDFGSATKFQSNQTFTERCGTPYYISPQLID